MKNYLLKPKKHLVKNELAIYHVEFITIDTVTTNVTSVIGLPGYKIKHHIAGECEETKRGWTFYLHFYCPRPVKIYLDRQDYDKIEVETDIEVQTILNNL